MNLDLKVLVTGGAGYIGSHTLLALTQAGFETVTLDNLSKGHRAAVRVGELVVGDISDARLLDELFQAHRFEAVVHFAANSLVGESMVDPAKYYVNNVSGGLQLLEAMQRHGVMRLVFSSTAAVYGEPEEVPIREDFTLQPTNVYGESKLMIEKILRDYSRAYGLRAISLRYFNAAGADPSGMIGEDHDPETHLIPLVLQAALKQRSEVRVFGTDYPTIDGTCIRDYIHVNDLAEAHVLTLQALLDGAETTAYNLGNGLGYSVREVITTTEEVIGQKLPVIEEGRRPGDPAALVASSERIQRELSWQPKFGDLRKIIETAWNWHRNHPQGFLG